MNKENLQNLTILDDFFFFFYLALHSNKRNINTIKNKKNKKRVKKRDRADLPDVKVAALGTLQPFAQKVPSDTRLRLENVQGNGPAITHNLLFLQHKSVFPPPLHPFSVPLYLPQVL